MNEKMIASIDVGSLLAASSSFQKPSLQELKNTQKLSNFRSATFASSGAMTIDV